MLWTFTVTCKIPSACHAFFWQTITLVNTKAYLFFGCHQSTQVGLEDIANPVVFIYEMIARIQVAVMLDNGISSACLCKCSYSRLYSAPKGQSGIELIDEHTADIVAHPIIKDITEKPAEALCAYRPRSDL